MSAYLVDTDWLIHVLHGDIAATRTLEDLAPQGLAISLITCGELYQGAYDARDPQPALQAIHDLLDGTDILPLTQTIMERFTIVRGQLTRNQRQQVGDMDLLIAASAIHHDLTLVTCHVRDDALVPGLTRYQPSCVLSTTYPIGCSIQVSPLLARSRLRLRLSCGELRGADVASDRPGHRRASAERDETEHAQR